MPAYARGSSQELKSARPRGSPSNMWSELHVDLLVAIAGHLALPDLVRFGAICTTWRTAALEERRLRRQDGPLSLRLPLLLLHQPTAKLGFFSTWRRGFIHLDLPEVFLGGGARCCGSSWGWLAMVDDAESDVCLLNPVTRARVQLPSRSHFPFRPCITTGETSRHPAHYLRKVVMSSEPTSRGCAVAAIGRSNLLALCRPGCGDTRWAYFVGRHSSSYEDVVFHGDQLYALDSQGGLTIYSLASSSPAVTIFAVLDPSEDVVSQQYWCLRRHLVRSSGELLMVEEILSYPGARLRVFKLGTNGWDPVKSLGDRMLFVGEVSTESMANGSARAPGFRANSICFTRRLVGMATPNAYMLFCMETGRTIPISVTDPHLPLEEPVWVMATL